MLRTLSFLGPLLGAMLFTPSHEESVTGPLIRPDVDPNGGGTGGAVPPAPTPAPVVVPPVADLQPVAAPPAPAPVAPGTPTPVTMPAPAAPAPATAPSASGNPAQPVTQADLNGLRTTLTQDFMAALRQAGIVPAAPASTPTPTAGAPVPAPTTTPAPTPAAPAPNAPAAPPANPTLTTQPPAEKSLEQRALETTIADLKKQLDDMTGENARAKQAASYTVTEDKIRKALTDHPTYRLAQDNANAAAEYLLAKNQVRADKAGKLWVVLTDPNGAEAVHEFGDGITKFLETPRGQVFRGGIPGGAGTHGAGNSFAPPFTSGGGNTNGMSPADGMAMAAAQQTAMMNGQRQ